MAEEVKAVVINPGVHRGVLIYSIKLDKESALPGFCTTEVKKFLERADVDSDQADFWTVKIGSDVLLLVCALDAYGTDWGGSGGVQHIDQYLAADKGVKIFLQSDWQFKKP